MKTLSPTFTRITLVACSACERPTAEQDLVPHYRGGGNSPLCPACANPATQTACGQCGELSPRNLLILGVCACVPAYELRALALNPEYTPEQPFGPEGPWSDEDEHRYQEWLTRREEELDWH